MAMRKNALKAVLRVARLREQQAAAHAQRERKRLHDALAAAAQLDQFAEEYRSDLAQLMLKGHGAVGFMQNTLDFALRLQTTASQQREASEPQRLRSQEAGQAHQTAKLRLDGLEKIERVEKRRELATLFGREARETEDSVTSRLHRRQGR
jgi:flagellar biosynthesis chaperone FliJ